MSFSQSLATFQVLCNYMWPVDKAETESSHHCQTDIVALRSRRPPDSNSLIFLNILLMGLQYCFQHF